MTVQLMQHLILLTIRLGLAAFLAGAVILVVHGLLTGGIRTDGMLRESDGTMSAARVQLFITTIAVLGAYIAKAAAFKRGDTALPDIDASLLGALGASHAINLSSKTWQTFFGGQS